MSKKSKIHLNEDTVFWGTIIGFVVGSIVWLFRVPKRGEETRQDIIDMGRNLINRGATTDNDEESSRVTDTPPQRSNK